MRLFIPALCLSVAACSQQTEAPQPAEENRQEAEAPEAEAEPVPSLEGEWAVTQIRGNALQQAYAMTVNATADRLTLRSDCVNIGWSYTQNDNLVVFDRAPVESCGRELTPDEEQAEKTIGGSTIAMFSEEGGQVQLSGSSGSLTLVRR